MAVAEELQILVNAKVSAAVRDLKKTQVETDKLGDSAKKLGAILKGAIPAVGFAGLAAATSQLISLASAAQESTNAVNVTFKSSADAIDAFGDTTATAIGLSKTEFSGLATVIGAQLKLSGLGMDQVADQTINLTTRAADLASVFNVDVKEATTALGAALRGETEPARRFGINISDAAVQAEALASGLVSSKSEITDQIKVQARLNLIFQQSKDVAGDFSNTSDGLANQLRILDANAKDLGASLGEVFLPAATDSVTALNDMIEPAKLAIDTFKDIIDALKGISENTALWQQAMTRATNPVTVVVDRIKELYGLVGFLLRDEEKVTVEKEAQLSLADGILAVEADIAAQNKIRTDAEKEINATLEARQAILDGFSQTSEEILQQAKNVDSAIGAGIVTEAEGLERKIELRQAAIDKIRDEAIASGITTKEVTENIALQQAAIERYETRLNDLTNTEGEQREIRIGRLNDWEERNASASEQIARINEENAKKIQASYENAFKFAGNAISDLTFALASGEDAYKSFAKVGLNALAELLAALGAKLAAIAAEGLALSFLPPFTGGGAVGPAIAGSAAAFAASGAIRAAAGSFQQGTPADQPFVVPGTPGRDSQPIMVEPGEEVTVNSRARSARGDSKMANITLNIDGRAFGKLILDLSRDRVVTLDRGALVAT